MQKVHEILKNYDVVICPHWAGNQGAITNLTGHPALSIPTGFNAKNLPTGITLIGNLYDEATLLEVAKIYQDVTPWDDVHPEFFKQ